ncbi:TolC family protein [Acinetobacter baumannii]|nr:MULTISPECIES: TolC family protein [Acinetobacter calcoaceticus/baumannii complex]ELB2464161.1 TolC family protein [Acinetobacter baumannii]MCT9381927.1 TolC family protein [Acinetobacter baumannii]MCZ2958898.1 TolC family protein [Acinetobacter baumannii]MDC4313348.1 TolC family protein [Acinetobacter baumannii]MDE1704288.1 TolC family protein [Acinetobacter nosocomialis]
MNKRDVLIKTSLCSLLSLYMPLLYAASGQEIATSLKDNLQGVFTPKSDDHFNKVDLKQLSNFDVDTSKFDELPVIGSTHSNTVNTGGLSLVSPTSRTLDISEAVKIAVQRHPEISQNIASLASQNANIDVAKAAYYPQLSGGISTGDMTSGERGRQLLSLNATQMVYDFGKVKSSVDIQKARLALQQAQVLVKIDEVALEVASAIVNLKRYEEVCRIAQQQVDGIARIAEIANLRANAGISSQADPVQAKSYLEASQSNLIAQQTQLRLYQQKLRTLLGFDISRINWKIPENVVTESKIFEAPKINTIPTIMSAQAEVNVAKAQKTQTDLSRYPTLNLVGTLSQALNGVNPNNNKDDGFDSSIKFEASSNFFQGGSVGAQSRAASYAEEAAKAKVQNSYMDILEQIRMTEEQVTNKQRQMQVLVARQSTTTRTKELYQEQYKLGTRTVVDLLNAEQAIHSANMEIENNRYDIYANLVQLISTTGQSRDVYHLNRLSIQGVEVQP